ncbi:hypothetical protein HOY82DRAFT_614233 [Tuber indicum]|nr:hypothetical protein HOY82DRAFT_614233 [Tuber indicum]
MDHGSYPRSLLIMDFGKTAQAILIANLPQKILSFLYLTYTSLCACMLSGYEWPLFSHHHSSLRVTSPSPRPVLRILASITLHLSHSSNDPKQPPPLVNLSVNIPREARDMGPAQKASVADKYSWDEV